MAASVHVLCFCLLSALHAGCFCLICNHLCPCCAAPNIHPFLLLLYGIDAVTYTYRTFSNDAPRAFCCFEACNGCLVMQFLVLVFLKRHTPPLLLVLLNYMRLFRLLRLIRFLKVCSQNPASVQFCMTDDQSAWKPASKHSLCVCVCP